MLGLALMVTQSFLYNAVFFTYALVLARFYGVAPERIGLFLVPFAIGNSSGRSSSAGSSTRPGAAS